MLSTVGEEKDIYENYGKTCFTIIRLGFVMFPIHKFPQSLFLFPRSNLDINNLNRSHETLIALYSCLYL